LNEYAQSESRINIGSAFHVWGNFFKQKKECAIIYHPKISVTDVTWQMQIIGRTVKMS